MVQVFLNNKSQSPQSVPEFNSPQPVSEQVLYEGPPAEG